RGGILVMPGKYFVSMLMVFEGKETLLTQPEAFNVKPLNNTSLPAPDRKALTEFQLKVADVARVVNGTMNYTNDLITKVAYLRQAALQTPNLSNEFGLELQAIDKELDAVYFAFYGVKAKASDEEVPPMQMTLNDRLSSVMNPHYSSTSAITQYQMDALEIVKEEFTPLYEKIKLLAETKIPNAEKALETAKAGYTPGRLPVWTK
ncbi:MAG TPA: hypothetical protein DCQ31_06705, partial [Bacteroidales bacterium]|nr:hypothetical protein [Bacteroidales bacterium]